MVALSGLAGLGCFTEEVQGSPTQRMVLVPYSGCMAAVASLEQRGAECIQGSDFSSCKATFPDVGRSLQSAVRYLVGGLL